MVSWSWDGIFCKFGKTVLMDEALLKSKYWTYIEEELPLVS